MVGPLLTMGVVPFMVSTTIPMLHPSGAFGGTVKLI